MVSNELERIFNFGGAQVRTVAGEDGEPWFVARDIGEILDLEDVRISLRSLPEDEKGRHSMPTLGGPQLMDMVNEPGLYRLIFQSRKAEAEVFKRWVFHDVLPAIRKTGKYVLPEDASIVDAIIAALPPERAEQLTELSRDSDQTLNGFPFHDD